MCGIAGFQLDPTEGIDARRLIRELLLGIEERGRHATGIAYFEGTQAYVQKGAIAASQFVNHIDGVPADTKTAICHTRFATKGSPQVNANNHPIDVNGILGTHNGCLGNDDELFDRIGPDNRLAEVDSEAIFATLKYGNEPVPAALARIKGSAAVAWLETAGDPSTLHVARVSSSPLMYAFTEGGSFIYASTTKALLRAKTALGLRFAAAPAEMPEGQYMKIRHGQVVAKESFITEARSMASLSAIERKALNIA